MTTLVAAAASSAKAITNARILLVTMMHFGPKTYVNGRTRCVGIYDDFMYVQVTMDQDFGQLLAECADNDVMMRRIGQVAQDLVIDDWRPCSFWVVGPDECAKHAFVRAILV